jgi:DNA-binding MurR/RpiR family transcriptional regulator
LAGPVKLTQSKKSVGSKVVNLEIKFLENLMKELNRREAKAASKKVLEKDNVISTGFRDCLALRKLCLA